ncbi:hypothetical protein D3C83_293200 [compost metagenome]
MLGHLRRIDLEQKSILDPQLDELKQAATAICRKTTPALAFRDRLDRFLIER